MIGKCVQITYCMDCRYRIKKRFTTFQDLRFISAGGTGMVKSDKFDLKGKQNLNFSWSHGVALLFHWHQMPCCSGIGPIDSQREIKDDICLLHIK